MTSKKIGMWFVTTIPASSIVRDLKQSISKTIFDFNGQNPQHGDFYTETITISNPDPVKEMRFVFSTLCAPSKYIITFYPMVGTIRPERKREVRLVVVVRQPCAINKNIPVYLKVGGEKFRCENTVSEFFVFCFRFIIIIFFCWKFRFTNFFFPKKKSI